METDTGYVPNSVEHGLGPYFKNFFSRYSGQTKINSWRRTILLYEDEKTYR